MDDKFKDPILVTQPYMPPIEEFHRYLDEIWDSKWLTNNGKFHQQLENALCEYLGVKYISLFANGTLALMIAIKALNISGEVITTPYSFIATTHALYWNDIKPVFVDIEPNYYNIDVFKIQSKITKNTSAILPVHVYGNPCNFEEIQKIADYHKLKIIYDAAHAFGVKQNHTSILNHGDLSVLSFHATKIFNTFEGGAIVCHDEKMKQRIDQLKNFGFVDELTIDALGINAKMNEFQAAFGLLQLKYVDSLIEKRKQIANIYFENLSNIAGISLMAVHQNTDYNYSYFPILINHNLSKITRDELYEHFHKFNIFARRYFYPLISNFPTYSCIPSSDANNLLVANNIASRVLCLPIYPNLAKEDVLKICKIIKNVV